MTKIKLTIKFKTPFSIKSGFGYAGILDDTIIRDGKGLFYIHGSTMKGRIKAYTMKLLATIGESICVEKNICKDTKQLCRICRIFGSPLKESPLIFTDATLDENRQTIFRMINRQTEGYPFPMDAVGVANIAMGRQRLTARDKSLFITELPPEGLIFHSYIIGDIAKNDLSILQKAIGLITHIGANKGRGIGRLVDDGITVEEIA